MAEVKSQADSKQRRGRKQGEGNKREKEEKAPTMWFAFKKSLQCKSEPCDVYDPKSKGQLSSILTKKAGGRSGCSRSIANLKDVIHGSKRHLEKPPSCSPRSIGSSEFLNPITHEVVLSSNSRCELRITGHGGSHDSSFVGMLTPGTPGPTWQHGLTHNGSFRGVRATPPRSPNVSSEREENGLGVSSLNHTSLRHRFSHEALRAGSGISCHRCGEHFGKWEALESHHLSQHAVTELAEGDSSRKIVELICRTSWLKTDNNCCRIERVLKVHNTQKTLARFEEYRETVKQRASKLPKKHPRCLADGNELLRFYGTTVSCPLGTNNCSSLCSSDNCNVCHIVRYGFSTKNEMKDGIGVFTTSTSGRAFESIKISGDDTPEKKALLVCRVIAGRVHKPLENLEEFAGQSGFDSLAGKVGLYANIEELFLLNPRALLPCFVVICKP
ncbi:zinc finger (C2H2 type) family protein [Rhynchospora pubera]|uniref:Zinc finger (C2H2 type) family protein n=1 Tax=Rhynchospora pubera TaxID=906938 RepID=A0AAV8FGQ0_9POAL|nr:zinc finger (C2H2 type) family protein [Rhynchospora pubera]